MRLLTISESLLLPIYKPIIIIFSLITTLLLTTAALANITSGLGTFTLDGGTSVTATSATGRYKTERGATGKFTITQDDMSGYEGNPTFQGGTNGLQVLNPSSRNNNNDRFTYTLTLLPDDSRIVNTIKIAQSSYRNSGNSEVAKQTLKYTNNNASGKSSRAYIAANPDVPFFYFAMGDYFMARQTRVNNDDPNNKRRFLPEQPVSQPQIRRDDSYTPLYFYTFNDIKTTKYNAPYNDYRIDINNRGYATLKPRIANPPAYFGSLPPQPTPEKLIKSLSDPSSYPALAEGSIIPNGGSYISYGVANADSKYVIDAYNAKSVTLSYEAIMRGNNAINNPSVSSNPESGNPTIIGETENEWITFGVTSEPPPNIIPAPPNLVEGIICPAGYISDNFASSDYAELAPNTTPPTPKDNHQVVGSKDESYIVATNYLTTNGALDSTGSNYYRPTTSAGVSLFEFYQDFADKYSTRTISYKFNNKFSGEPTSLEKFSLSIMDIDSYYVGSDGESDYYEFMDSASIKGYTAAGDEVIPSVTFKGANISSSPPFNQDLRGRSSSCDNDKLDGNCQISVTFNQPIVQVDITYGNNSNLNYYDIGDDDRDGVRYNDPGDQYIGVKIDGYCYKPQPRLTYHKQLADPRLTDTDEFIVQIQDDRDTIVTDALSTTTTSGEGSVVNNGTGTTGVFKVDPTRTYTLSEVAVDSTNLDNYVASYQCRRSDGSQISTLDPTKLKLDYGDNWTCTVTNSQRKYTISGIVFNDNGGIIDPLANNVSSIYLDNSDYFDGEYDPDVPSNETGISYTPGHSITLAKCANDNSSGNFESQTINIGSDGRYKFELAAAQLANNSQLCLTQNEPTDYDYPIDTTANQLTLDINRSIFDYPRNDFGDVVEANTALVLIKRQYVHDCSNTDLTDIAVNDNVSPLEAFSKRSIDGISPGQCIGYRIEAINRGHIQLTEVIIHDALPKQGDGNSSITSTLFTLPTSLSKSIEFDAKSVQLNKNGLIITKGFLLDHTPNTYKATIVFNTKYGLINKIP